MKVLEFTGLKNVQKVTAGLSQLLADLQVFYTNIRGFHWNIKGKNFYVLHKKFEDMYNDAAEKVDEIANVPISHDRPGKSLETRTADL